MKTISVSSRTYKCILSSIFASGAIKFLPKCQIIYVINPSVMEQWSMRILVVCTKVSCLCLRNWRKWMFVYVRRISIKSSLRVMILRRISGTFVKGQTRLRKWNLRKVCLGINCMCQCHLV